MEGNKEKNYSKFNIFLDIFDDLTEYDMFHSSKFSKKEGLKIILDHGC